MRIKEIVAAIANHDVVRQLSIVADLNAAFGFDEAAISYGNIVAKGKPVRGSDSNPWMDGYTNAA